MDEEPTRGRIGVVVQARMTSSRLPGKVALPIGDRPSLALLVERLRRSDGIDGMVVATSEDSDDDAVAALAKSLGVPCHRGPRDDVAGRLLGASRAGDFDALVRICADSPLLDPALVSVAVALYRSGWSDLVSNVFPRSFPKGQSVEVISNAALRRVVTLSNAPDDREHVTKYIYNNPISFKITSFQRSPSRSEIRMCVDTHEDYMRINQLAIKLGSNVIRASLEELIVAHDDLFLNNVDRQ